MSKTKITYRFSEGKGKVIPLNQEEYQVSEQSDPLFDSQSLNEFTTDFGAWSSPFDVETEQLEKIIRESDRTPKVNRTEEQSDYRRESRAQENRRQAYASRYEPELKAATYVRRSTTPWAKIITSVSGAIITGVVFGIFVLSLFADDGRGTPETGNGSLTTDQTTTQVETSDRSYAEESIIPVDEAGIQVNIPAHSFFVLQNGVFNSEDGAKAATEALIAKGFAAANEIDDGYIVYAGISTNRDDALMLTHQLQEHEFETYIKSYTIPAIQNILYQGENPQEIVNYFVQGNRLVEMISNLSVIHLQQITAQDIENTAIETLTKAHQDWNQLTAQVNKGIPKEHKSLMDKANNTMTTAMISLEEYRKNADFSYLWQTQSALLEYIILQKELLAQISINHHSNLSSTHGSNGFE